jgi:predicted MPP superfamily phosphohydrolase
LTWAIAAGALFSTGFSGSPSRIHRGPYLQSAPSGGLAVVWYTEAPSSGRLQWRQEEGDWEDIETASAPGRRHEFDLPYLRESARYSYRVLDPETEGALANLEAEREFSFRTPAPGLFKFAAFGDSGARSTPQRTIANLVLKESPPVDMVLLTGDVVYPHGSDADYDAKFFSPYGRLLSRVPFFSAMGNHDYESGNGSPYLDVFSLPRNGPRGLTPETVYSFERAGLLITVHDSNLGRTAIREHAAPWQEQVARASRSRFRLAALHHSPYSSAINSVASDVQMVRESYSPVFSRSGVDLVLGGHDHVYERTRPLEGVVYVTTGAGGASLYPRIRRNAYTEVFYGEGNKHSFSVVEVDGANLMLRQTDIDGCAVDRVGLYKPLGKGDRWRVQRGAGPPPAKWHQPSFDDTGWPLVASPFGYGGTDLEEVLPDMAGSYLTVYARRSFALAPGEVDQVLLRLRYDDGFVAFLNGVEVARRNVSDGQDHLSAASAAHEGDGFETFVIPAAHLRVGTNVVAIEGHNVSLESSDFVLAPELTLVAGDPGNCR